MKNCWIIAGREAQEQLQSFREIFAGHGYQVYWNTEIGESVPEPEFILFSGHEDELSALLKRHGDVPVFLLSSLSSGLFFPLLKRPVYPIILLNRSGKLDGMMLGLDRGTQAKNFRRMLRDFAVPIVVMDRIEVFIAHYIYNHWHEVKDRFFEVLHHLCFTYRCDGVAILRGLGLASEIGQMHTLPSFTDEPWQEVLRQVMKQMGGEQTVCWDNGPDFSFSGIDLLLILEKDEQLSRMKVKIWEKYKHLFRQPHIIDCVNVYEPEELKAAGFLYLSLFRYRFLLNRK